MLSLVRRPVLPSGAAPLLTAAVVLLLALEAGLGYAANDMQRMLLYVAALAAVVFVGATALRPRLTAPVLLFVLYGRLSDAGGPNGWLLAVEVLFLASLLLWSLARREGLIGDRLLGWMLAFGAAIAISAVGAAWLGGVANDLRDYLREVATIFVLVNLFPSLGGLRRAAWTVVAAGVFLAAVAVVHARTGIELGRLTTDNTGQIAGTVVGSRAASTIGDANSFADVLVIAFAIALYRAWDEPRRVLRVTALLAAAILGLGVVLTYSRDGGLGLLVVLFFALKRLRVRPAHLLAITLALGTLVIAAPSSYWARFGAAAGFVTGSDTAMARSDGSLQERSLLWRVGALMFLEHPLTGVGKGNYEIASEDTAWRVDPSVRPGRMAHSAPVQYAAETGLLGLATLAGTWIVAVANLREARRRFAGAGRPGGVVLAESVEVAIYAHLVILLFLGDDYPRYSWLLMGLAMVARQASLRISRAAAPSRAIDVRAASQPVATRATAPRRGALGQRLAPQA